MRELVNQVMESGRISYGPMSRTLEERFAALHGCRHAVLSNSGTSSLQVALQALKELHGWQDGDEVIVPAVTFVATVNIVLHNRLTPVLVDVEPDYYELDPALIERAITPRTRAIIPVHLFGQPAEMTAIAPIADRYGLAVLEDSCETMFAGHGGRPAGAWGDVAAFSMYVAHLLPAGVGGLSTTNNPDLAVIMRSLVNHGRDGIYLSIDDDKGLSRSALREVVSRRFRFERIGHSFRVTELEAALALGQLDGWPQMIRARQANAHHLTAALVPYAEWLQLPVVRPNTTHSWMMYPLVLRREPKAGLVDFLEQRGVETREMLPLTNQPAYRDWCREGDYPVAKWINESGFYVGCHQDLTEYELEYVGATIGAYFARQKARAA